LFLIKNNCQKQKLFLYLHFKIKLPKYVKLLIVRDYFIKKVLFLKENKQTDLIKKTPLIRSKDLKNKGLIFPFY